MASKPSLKVQMQHLIYQPDVADEELFREMRRLLEQETAGVYEQEDAPTAIGELLKNNHLPELEDKKIGSPLIPTGFTEYDRIIGGLMPGEMVVLSGRPAMGKTLLLINLLLQLPSDVPALFFGLDCSRHSLGYRFLSSSSGIPIDRLLQRRLRQGDHERLRDAAAILAERPIQLGSNSSMRLSSLIDACEEYISKHQVRVIVVDPIQMIRSFHHRQNREGEIAYICRELKQLARKHGICLLLSSQMNRNPEHRGGNKEPMLSDMRDSGLLEELADKVLFLYRPAYYGFSETSRGENSQGMAELIVAKNRTGPITTVPLYHDHYFTRFVDYNGQEDEITFSEERLEDLL